MTWEYRSGLPGISYFKGLIVGWPSMVPAASSIYIYKDDKKTKPNGDIYTTLG
jgi:hypothetical protein